MPGYSPMGQLTLGGIGGPNIDPRRAENLIELARIRGLSMPSAVQEHLDQIAHAQGYDPRQNPELHPPQAPESDPTLFQLLMQQAMGSNSRSSLRAATAPQRAAIKAIQENIGLIGAQTAQNQADIGSWFGQLQGDYSHNARAAGRSGRKAARGDTRTGKGLMKGIADPNVARVVGSAALRESAFARNQGNTEAAFARNQGADAARQGAYQQLVQARLGAQQEMAARQQLAEAQAAKVTARQSAQSANMDNIMQLLGIVGDNPTVDAVLGLPHAEDGSDALAQGSALQSALGNVDFFDSADDGGRPRGDFNQLLQKAYAAARARGLDLSDPRVRDGIRNYIQANVAGDYNSQMGTHYGLQPNGSFGGGQ